MRQPFIDKRFLIILIALIIFLLTLPLLDSFRYSHTFVSVTFVLTLIAGVYVVSHNHGLLLFALGFAILAALSRGALGFVSPDFIKIANDFFAFCFYIFLSIVILLRVLSGSKVTIDKLYGAITVYLLVGLAWSYLYEIIAVINPEAFHFSYIPSSTYNYAASYVYYSFVTLTTLGYGDIVPLTSVAKTFAYFEAVLGQIYLIIIISHLVGVHVAQVSHRRKS